MARTRTSVISLSEDIISFLYRHCELFCTIVPVIASSDRKAVRAWKGVFAAQILCNSEVYRSNSRFVAKSVSPCSHGPYILMDSCTRFSTASTTRTGSSRAASKSKWVNLSIKSSSARSYPRKRGCLEFGFASNGLMEGQYHRPITEKLGQQGPELGFQSCFRGGTWV